MHAHTSRYPARVNDLVSGDGRSLLHLAVSFSQPAVVDLLLRSNADADRVDQLGTSPLHLAAKRGDVPSTLALLQRPVDVNRATRVRCGLNRLERCSMQEL